METEPHETRQYEALIPSEAIEVDDTQIIQINESWHSVFIEMSDRMGRSLRPDLKEAFDRRGYGFSEIILPELNDEVLYRGYVIETQQGRVYIGRGWLPPSSWFPEYDGERPAPAIYADPGVTKESIQDVIKEYYRAHFSQDEIAMENAERFHSIF